MDTESYIINDVEPIDVSVKIREAQSVFNQLTYTHIPVEKNGHYVGCVSENDVYCFETSKTLGDFEYALEPFHVLEDTNWLDVLEAFAVHKSNIMPVLGDDNQYLGYYELSDIMSLFNNTPFLNENGGIIVIEKGIQEYSFSEVCQIVESNGARIFGLFISEINDETVQITLKVGQTGMNSIVQTFRRYNYTVISHHQEDKFLEDLKERSKYLDKYLNI
ncbi:CBS domain-containing protein [Aequorivita sp. H23M31]|uniref:CBS domain-containing protein n=1 Tax=Aequorivita ciconiae TaxID=2494375 RepID=A0A410G3T5_9FLAO|nr:CBS domain-containing protein [Aequorivita sp. H23M31]QAA81911.1 CBS domain-containing protein [Aequorivita sp. H23M31]